MTRRQHYKVEDPVEFEALCLANQLLTCVESLVLFPTAKTVRRVSDELDGWASSRADILEVLEQGGSHLSENQDTIYDPRARRAELLLRILEADR